MLRDQTVTGVENDPRDAYLTALELRREFHLTDAHLARLGPADRSEPVPGEGPPRLRQVYARDRVERWMAENRALLDDSNARRMRRDARREEEQGAAAAQRQEARRQVVAALRDADRRELPSLASVRPRIASPLEAGFEETDAHLIDMAILNYALANLAGYSQLTRLLNRVDAGFELTAAVRIHVCGRLIRHFRLALDPLDAAFPAGTRGKLPPAFAAGNPETVADTLIASES